MTPRTPYIHWIRTAVLFLLRSGRSTLALSLMVVAAVASLIFLSAFAVGVNDAMVRNSVGLFSGHISATGLPPAITPENLRVKGVTRVLKRVRVPGTLWLENHAETLTLIGVDPAAEQDATAFARKIIAGKGLQAGVREILLGSASANRLGAGTGDNIRFTADGLDHPVTFTIAGIFRTGIAPLDQGVALCPAGALPVKPGDWSAAVFIKDGLSPESIVATYYERFGAAGSFETWRQAMPDLVQLIQLNYISMSIVMVLVFGVVSLGIACAFVVFIFKSLQEYGIMKAMGVTSGEVAFLISAEVVLMNLAACLAGGLIGVAAVVFFSHTGIDLTPWTTHNQYFAVSGEIFPRLTRYSLIVPPGVALAFGLASAVWPALLVARKKAVDILKVM